MIKDFDEDMEQKRACEECRTKYLSGLKKLVGYIPEWETHMTIIKRVFSDCIREMDENTPSKHEFFFWDVIAYIAGFNMEYHYVGKVCEETPKTGKQEWNVVGLSDEIPEVGDQQIIKKLMIDYLLAGAALAKRIGSSTYKTWTDLLIQITYGTNGFSRLFKEAKEADCFNETLVSVRRQIWVDSEVYRYNLALKTKE